MHSWPRVKPLIVLPSCWVIKTGIPLVLAHFQYILTHRKLSFSISKYLCQIQKSIVHWSKYQRMEHPVSKCFPFLLTWELLIKWLSKPISTHCYWKYPRFDIENSSIVAHHIKISALKNFQLTNLIKPKSLIFKIKPAL